MQNTQKTPKTIAGHGFTQFELTTAIVKNLKHFKDLNLTAVTKLVLIELSTHYNEAENGAVVFPSLEYIAETIGQSLTSVKQAVRDLINAGLIIKTKRSNVKGNFNKYLLTSKITGLKRIFVMDLSRSEQKVQNTTSEPSENKLLKQSDSDLFLIRTNKHEQIKEQINNKVVKILPKSVIKYNKNKENIPEFDNILRKHVKTLSWAKNEIAVINWLKKTGQAEKIVNDILEGQKQSEIMCKKINRLVEQNKIDAQNASTEIPQIWLDFKKKLQ